MRFVVLRFQTAAVLEKFVAAIKDQELSGLEAEVLSDAILLLTEVSDTGTNLLATSQGVGFSSLFSNWGKHWHENLALQKEFTADLMDRGEPFVTAYWGDKTAVISASEYNETVLDRPVHKE